jgi:hypothetical protein
VGVGIAFAVAEFPTVGGDMIQREAYVMGYVGIGVLVYRNRRRRVGDKHHADTFPYPGTGDGFLYLGADIYPFAFSAGFYGDFLQTRHGFSFLPGSMSFRPGREI